MDDGRGVTTFLFTDIEGSTRLWEEQPERMRDALVRHDALLRRAVEANGGSVVKRTGDGIHAAFGVPAAAIAAAIAIQRGLADPAATAGLALRVRCGIHAGDIERRDDDYFGSVVNRASRIASAAHGGQTLVSHAVVELVADRLPPGAALCDLGTVRLRDLSGPLRVFQLVHADLRAKFPALRSLEATPNNLPQQLTTFVGRERELADVRERLRRGRMLTLCGAGGLGKTRMSLQLAGAVLGEYPDGAWFVDLAPIHDPALVPSAVAAVLGVREEPGGGVTDALLAFVRDRELLLILDNCEHLVDACAGLAARLLQAGRRLALVATSREALRVPGESTYAMPALAVPPPGHEHDLGAMSQCAAVHLFVDRATAVQPAFALTQRNAAQVAEICRRLDGMPLAIELAAARLSSMSVDAVAARVGDAMRLLSGGARTALPRQQTLRALIDWSHDLLSDAERVLFRRIGVFVGGWTIDAAEAVVGGEPVAREEVLDLLASLVDKSLVVLEPESGRYHMLDTIRQFAAERLRTSGEEASLRRRHLDHFLALAESVRPDLSSSSSAEALSRLDRERDNLLAAHAACRSADVPASLGHRLVHALRPYWINRSLDVGLRLTLEAADRGRDDPPSSARAFALFSAGQLCAYVGRYAAARPHLVQSLAVARAVREDALASASLQFLALAALGEGDRGSAREFSREGLALARSLGNPLEIAGACTALAQLCRMDGEVEEAAALLDEALALSRRQRNVEYETTALLNLATFAVERGDAARARALLREGLAMAQAAGSRHLALTALEGTVGLAALEREWQRAARLYGFAETQARELGIGRDPVDEAFLQRQVAAVRSALSETEFREAESSGIALPADAGMKDAASWLGVGT